MTIRRLPPRFHDGLPERLAAEGVPPAAAEALLALDADLFLFLRQAMKGEVAGRILADLGLDLELSQFHALTAVSRIEHGVGRDAPEPPTVGLLAEELNLDPSRASRIAADLIARGYLRREAAQDDGRKSVLRLTDRAVSALRAWRDAKWDRVLAVFRDWPEAEVVTFARLFGRYAEGIARVSRG